MTTRTTSPRKHAPHGEPPSAGTPAGRTTSQRRGSQKYERSSSNSAAASLPPEGERPQRRDVAAAVVLPDLVHGRADVAVLVEVDRAERTLVVDLLVRKHELDRLRQRLERHLRTGRPRHGNQVVPDLRRRRGAAAQRGEERDVRGVERRAFEPGERLCALDRLVPEDVER